MTRREFRELSPPAAVRSAIEDLDLGGGPVSVPLADATGRVLAARAEAGLDVPGFDRASMDGVAVRAADTVGAGESDPVELRVVGTVEAGEPPPDGLESGAAIRAATGAVMPADADAVVPVEQTYEPERDGATGPDRVAVTTPVAPGANVMPRGADVAAGDRALGPGTHLSPRHVGLLAALGQETVAVRARPTVAILATGEELVQPGEPLAPERGEIYDVNSHAIAAAVEAAGGEAVVRTPVVDDRAAIEAAIADAAGEADLLLTSGSTSAGAVDLVQDVIHEAGEVLVHGVALKPGRPMLVGRIEDTAYVGLPGYPVSAMTVFRTFVAPALRAAAGKPEPAAAETEATLATRVRYDGGRLRLLPVGLVADGDGDRLAYAPRKGSGATTSLVETDGVVRMPPERNLLSVGDTVTVERFDADDPLPSLLSIGEPDPVMDAALDQVRHARHLSLAPTDARRWLEDDVPDVVVATGDGVGGGLGNDVDEESGAGTPQATATAAGIGHRVLGRWRREWGLALADDVDVADSRALADGDHTFANLAPAIGLRSALDAHLETATGDAAAVPGDIEGYERELPGLKSAALAVAAGRADVGLALRTTADNLGVGFVPLGSQPVHVAAHPDRIDKPGVRSLRAQLDDKLSVLLDEQSGYEVIQAGD